MNAAQVFEQSYTEARFKSFKENRWGQRHADAILYPKGFEAPIVRLLDALTLYADEHKARYEAPIADDGVLGQEWLAIAKAVRGLLNGELGRLDGGTLDTLLYDLTEAAGFKRSELE